MGSTPSLPATTDVDDIIASTGLTKKAIRALWTRFKDLDRDVSGGDSKGYLTLDDLSRVPKFDENPIAPRLMKVIFDDFGTNDKLNFKQFAQFMSIFSRRETHLSLRARTDSNKNTLKNYETDVRYSMYDTILAKKIKFMFRMYDIDRDGKISKEDAQETLKMMVGEISDEEASIIAEKVIDEFTDNNPNAVVNLTNFERTLLLIDFKDKMGLKLLK
ncbi:unnamed protein product [Didymodactylos carnosus]|uniref:EF-hand domain-containing protein n=1 Tax=Didymodactylos carnosus TaxID=1234261 RepID=A0A814MX05_9BILA|nr:unnamed protein product [Didymodactylos carnosus]CAF1085089.1 unnamed protein product [Didymodactylos carnosus]CAF3709916.1 unnamed protein product [Didymodactylos carnosus]CAF3850694.1 unnamed protein product [Didymodactylos carnosus]